MEANQTDETIELTTHHFWFRKPHFALDKDLYTRWTVFAVEEGKFAYEIGGKSGEAGFGDLVICPPNVWFHRRAIEPLTFHFIHFHILNKSSEAEQLLLPPGIITITDTGRLSSSYDYLRRLADRADKQANCWKTHLFQDIIHLHQMEKSMQTSKASPTNIEAEMLWAKEFIKGKAFGDLCMRELAEGLNITPVQLTRRFRSAYGMTPTEYLTKLRIDRVSRLLEETSLSLDEIAQRVGYENGFYLSRVFSKHKNISPSAYRKLRLV